MRRLFLCFILCFCAHARAATFVVTNNSDAATDGVCDVSGTGDGCTLREAINAANADSDDSTITFDATVFAAPRQTITIGSSLPDITTNLSITAPSAGVVVRSVTNNTTVFNSNNSSAHTTLTGLTVQSSFIGVLGDGAKTTLQGCTLQGTDIAFAQSGGQATLQNCTVTGSGRGIGAGLSTVTVQNCTVTGNTFGIAISEGAVNLSNSIVVGNATNIRGRNYGNDDGTNLTSGTADAAGLETTDGVNAVVLKDNGGPTPTIALVKNGTAVDAGNSTLTTDQRGYGRPVDLATANATGGNGSDIGAYEVNETATSGANFVVTKTDDHDDGACGPTDCTLREAINAANANANKSIITFQSGLSGTIQLDSELPTLSSKIDLQGPGAANLTVRGEGSADPYRIFLANTGGPPTAVISISGLTLANGQATYVGGGAIANNYCFLTLSNCVITGNSGDDGGAIYTAGATSVGSLTVTGCTFSNNTGTFAGGAIFNDGFNGDAKLTVTNCTFSGNSTSGTGGAIYTNGGSQAGLTGNSNVTVTGSTFAQNTANDNGGALCSSGDDGSATLTVTNSTFASNTATNGDGGAILSSGINGSANANIVNCTFNDNAAGNKGGGLYSDGAGGLATATVKSCTFKVNNASFGGSAIWSAGATASKVQIRNNIFAVGTAGITLADDSNASLVSQGYNLADDTGGGYLTATGDQSNVADLKLDVLADNGGPTQTIALLPGSPAIDAGKSVLTTDQRGNFRPIDFSSIANATGGDGSDVGAYELNEAAQAGSDFVVNTAADHDDGTCGPEDCSLREAVNAANADAANNTITFSPTVFDTKKTIALTLGQLSIADNGTLTITAPTAGVIVSGNNQSRIFSNPTVNLTLTRLTMTKGTTGNTAANGGAIENGGNLTLVNCTISNSSATNGGAADNTGTLTAQSCTFSNDSGGYGGALLNSGTLIVENSTFASNTGFNNGGAFHNSSGSATFTNCTFSGNQALGGGNVGNGGGISNFGNLTINNSTLSLNHANGLGGGVFSDANATLNINNSIVAGNTANIDGADISGTLASGDYNLVQETSGVTLSGTHNLTGQAPNLGPLANNGGPTQTFALLSGSLAINAGDPAFNGAGETDQRGNGFPRVHGGRVDIGAFESLGQAPTDIALANNSVAENSGPDAAIGSLSATDPDLADSASFTLPANRGSNNLFTIEKTGVLQAKGSLNYEKQNSYVIFVHATDSDGLSFDKKLTITVTDTNDAPVLDNSGNVQLTVSAKGTGISDLLATGANGAPISDEDAGAVQGIAAFAADNVYGMWQFTTNGGATWTPLGTASSSHVRLLAADNGSTRLRFLPKSAKAAPPLANALKFFAWDQSSGANGAVADASPALHRASRTQAAASPALRGGKSAFSLAFESVTVLAPGSAGPQITIAIPQKGTFAVSPAQATGTANADSGILEVRCLYLYRTNAGGNRTGYWNGDVANPRFGAYSINNQRLATDTATGGAEAYSTWSLNLPVLSQGTYDLRMQAKDAYGKVRAKDVIFTINDGTPRVAFTAPHDGSSYPVGSLSEATGTASDADGISKVTLYLYRDAGGSLPAGYWNGDLANPQFTPTYSPSTSERPATDTATGGAPAYATWRRLLPALTEGSYTLRVTARDTVGNFAFAISHITITAAQSTPVAAPVATPTAVAYASADSVALTFPAAIPSGDFAVTVNGASVGVQSAASSGKTVTLLLPEGALKVGDEIGVNWEGGTLTLKAE